MCNFCEMNKQGMTEEGFIEEHDLGIMGSMFVTCGIFYPTDDYNATLIIATDIRQGKKSTKNLLIQRDIFYCPMCGRKLGE